MKIGYLLSIKWTFQRACSYFYQSSEESDEGIGESEDTVKQRIAREFHYAEDRDKESSSEQEDAEDDPLEAFMAGIEVVKQVSFVLSERVL